MEVLSMIGSISSILRLLIAIFLTKEVITIKNKMKFPITANCGVSCLKLKKF